MLDSLWLLCLLYINSTRLPTSSTPSLSHWILPIYSHMYSKSFARWLADRLLGLMEKAEVNGFDLNAHTLHVEKRQKILYAQWEKTKTEQNDICKCDAISTMDASRYLFMVHALVITLAHKESEWERETHTFIMLLLWRSFITIAILLFIIIPLYSVCVMCGYARYCVKFTRRLWWLHIEIDFIFSFSLSRINVNV